MFGVEIAKLGAKGYRRSRWLGVSCSMLDWNYFERPIE